MLTETPPLSAADVRSLLERRLPDDQFGRVVKLIEKFGANCSAQITAIFTLAYHKENGHAGKLLEEFEKCPIPASYNHALVALAQGANRHLGVVPFKFSL